MSAATFQLYTFTSPPAPLGGRVPPLVEKAFLLFPLPLGKFGCKGVLINEFRKGRPIQTAEEWHESKTGLLITAIYKSGGQECVLTPLKTNIPELGGGLNRS